jgi:hypothetical protein
MVRVPAPSNALCQWSTTICRGGTVVVTVAVTIDVVGLVDVVAMVVDVWALQPLV